MAWTVTVSDVSQKGGLEEGIVVTLDFLDAGVLRFSRKVNFFSPGGQYVFCQPLNLAPVKVADVPNMDKLMPIPATGLKS